MSPIVRTLVLATGLVACGGQRSGQTVTSPAPSTVEPTTLPTGSRSDTITQTTPHDVPPYVTGLRGMLAAHHTDDLPGREALDVHENALDGLIWLSAHGETMVERVRATQLLGLYDEPEATETLMGIASDDAPPALMAAGVRGLGTQGLDGRDDAIAVVRNRLRHEDVRVSTAAVEAFAASPGTAVELPTIAGDDSYPQSVRDAAASENTE